MSQTFIFRATGTANIIGVALIMALLCAYQDIRGATAFFESPLSVRSFSERIRFDHLNIEDGLSQNTVRAILQDRLGLMWFGTDEGLNRYDGYTFTVYQHDPLREDSLGGSAVLSLLEDRQGRLWIGTDQGLDCFDRASETFSHDYAGGEEPFGAVQALVAGPDTDTLWIGTAAHGLAVMEVDTGQVIRYAHDPLNPHSLANNSVYALLHAHDGELWVATDGGLDRFNPATGRFQHYQQDATSPNSPTSNRVRALWEDEAGMLWIGTDGSGLNRLDPRTGQFTFYLHSSADQASLSDDRVHAITAGGQGSLWVATRIGLNRFDPNKNAFTRFLPDPNDPQSLSGSQVLALFADRTGIVWIGTADAGISQYKPGAHRFRHYLVPQLGAEEGSGAAVYAVLEDSAGPLWVGAVQTGLLQLDRASGTWKTYRHSLEDPHTLANDSVSALAQDPQGNLWVGTMGGGLDRFDPRTGWFAHYRSQAGSVDSLSSNNISSLLVDGSGRLWVGTQDGGLNRLDPGQNTFRRYRHNTQDTATLSSDQILSLYQDVQGDLWVGTFDAGLNRLVAQTGQFERFSNDTQNLNSLSHNQILSLAEDLQGSLWVGTKAGLNRFDRLSQTFKRYLVSDGLPGNTVNCIQADDAGRLWVGTVNGMARFDPRDDTFRAYKVEDGLQSREFIEGACSQSPRGELFFGGVQGFNAFFPQELEAQMPPPPVIITAFKKHDQTVQRDLTGEEHIGLSYQDDQIAFEFAALDYNAPARNRYAYRLEGFDAAWIDAGDRRFASYTNLKGGSYTFRVRAANSDGVWNDTGVIVPITVRPPVWEMAWFRVLAALLTVSLGYGAYRLRVESIQQRASALEKRVAELSQQVQEAAVAAERSRVARDLHDSVTQSLYSLVLMAEAGLRTLEAGRPAESREQVARVGQIAQQALQEMRLMVFALRQPELEKHGLAGALEYRLEAVERRSGVQARLTVQEALVLSPQTEAGLFLLAQEALNNALKHANADSVSVQMGIVDERLVLQIRDNGRGFDLARAMQGGGYGLTSMRERAEKMGGQISIDTAPGAGTEIRVDLPIVETQLEKKPK